MSEKLEQQALIQYSKYHWWGDFIFAIPNGGSRHVLEAVNLKKEGVKAGVPDLFMAIPSDDYHGFFIEMKWGKNKLSANQREWFKNLREQNYKCVVCYSCEEAVKAIKEYLSVEYKK